MSRIDTDFYSSVSIRVIRGRQLKVWFHDKPYPLIEYFRVQQLGLGQRLFDCIA